MFKKSLKTPQKNVSPAARLIPGPLVKSWLRAWLQQMIRNPAYDGSSEEDEEIDSVDIAPLISSLTTPIVTAPERDLIGV